jgi:hypothetical protein
MLDPSVAAAILAEAPAMYIADASGRLMMTTPRLEALHRAVTAGSSDEPLSRWPAITEALDRLRKGEDEVALRHQLSGADFQSVHRRTRDAGGRPIYRASLPTDRRR